MPAMKSRSSIASGTSKNSEYGLPKVSYYPPVVATLLAAVFIFALLAGLCTIMVLNTGTQWQHVSNNEPESSVFSVGLCGLLTLVFLGAALYFFAAIIKGVRDLGASVHYTRGTVIEQQIPGSRKVKNWLVVNPTYLGPDLDRASLVTDEQRAASVDRSQIVQPRGMKGEIEKSDKVLGASTGEELETKLTSTSKAGGGYLKPERISSSPYEEKREIESASVDKEPTPHITFRSDFASHVQLRADEEVIIAHSPHLQHAYYIARLLNGEWEVHQNKALI